MSSSQEPENQKPENKEEQQYLDLLKHIMDNGTWETGRNGRVKTVFGNMMRFSLADGRIPILTTKKTAWKTCLKELLWFISGKTDNKILKEQGVHIWDANGSREFLDSRGLQHYEVDELGPIYGRQWRHFNAPWQGNDYDCSGEGVDQLQQIIDALKHPTERFSRRLIMTAWNPCQLDQMALPPCHILCQFNVQDGNKLSCALYQRSNDEACGTAINIASYSFLTHLLAKHCGLVAHEFVYMKGNCHIYEEHIEGLKTQMERKPYSFPTVSIKQVRDNINDYTVDDFVVENYQHHDPIKFVMVA
jgi:thymidylate synthase